MGYAVAQEGGRPSGRVNRIKPVVMEIEMKVCRRKSQGREMGRGVLPHGIISQAVSAADSGEGEWASSQPRGYRSRSALSGPADVNTSVNVTRPNGGSPRRTPNICRTRPILLLLATSPSYWHSPTHGKTNIVLHGQQKVQNFHTRVDC